MSKEELITIIIKSPKERKDISIDINSTIKQVKGICSQEFSASVDQICVIFSGKILNDSDALKKVGVRDGSSLHLVIKSALRAADESTDRVEQRVLANMPAADIGATPFGLGQLGGLSGLSGLGMGSANFMDLQQRMMQEMVNNPELLKSLLDSPFVQQMMSNPDTMRALMQTNPQLLEVMERNPEIIQTMADPELMKRMIEVVRSPAMLQELMRGQEHLVGVRTSSSATGASPSKKGQASATHAATPATVSDFYGDASMRSLLQQIAVNPQLMTNMMQAPYVQTMMTSMSTNPELVEQMLRNSHLFANSPELQQYLPQAIPFFSQQLLNPEIQNLMSNQKALQALLLIQQGMQELHAAVPAALTPSSSTQNTEPTNAYSQYMELMLRMVSKTEDGQVPPDAYALQRQQLSMMGFNNTDANDEVLSATQGDLNAAVNRLLQQR